MAQLVGLIVSEEEGFRKHFSRALRSGPVPVSVLDDRVQRDGTQPDVVIVDIREDATSALPTLERLRASSPSAGIFVVATATDADLILQTMRSGANEFFTWPPA